MYYAYANLSQWLCLCIGNGLVRVPAERYRDFERFYKEIAARYRFPGRFYHTLGHINDCLRKLEQWEIETGLKAKPEERFAIWLHDVIYDATAKDNEKKSAEFATDLLFALDRLVSCCTAQLVKELILATKHDEVPRNLGTCLITDIDLFSLGASEKVFDANRRAIRKEYAHLSEAEFEKGNQEFLKALLARPKIYSLPYFQNRHEAQARRNIVRVLEG